MECSHSHVKADVDFAYCPDCGELIENQWYLVRCACCGVKLRGMIKNGEVDYFRPGNKTFYVNVDSFMALCAGRNLK